MIRSLITLLVVALAFAASPAQGEEAANPAKAAVGRSVYRAYCGSCHGKEARGDGPVAQYLSPRPSDLTLIRQRRDGEFPREEIQRIIDGREEVPGHGSGEMPVWGDAFITAGAADQEAVREKIENLVHFLQSIQQPAPGGS